MAAIISTAKGTNNVLAKAVELDMSRNITLLDPEVAPLLVLTKGLKTESCSNYKFEWFEKDYMARWTSASVAVADGVATTITVPTADAALIAVDDLMKVVATGEVFRVTAINTGTGALTVQRGYGETTPVAIAQYAKIMVLGNAIMQGADTPAEKYNEVVPVYNYTQIFRTPYSITGTLDHTKLYTGKKLAELRADKGIEHKKSIEASFLFGERKLDLTGAQPRTTTGGVLKTLAGTSNVVEVAKASATEADLEAFCEKVFATGSDERVLMASPSVITFVQKLWKDKLRFIQSDKDKSYGLNINKYETPHGVLNIVKHKMLTNGYDGWSIALDMKDLKYRPLEGRDTKLLPNRQAAGEDGIREEYLTECGIELRHASHHGIFRLT